jgi:hypothetical protein
VGLYTRIRGGLKHLHHPVARNTIKGILKDHGIGPAPERGMRPSRSFRPMAEGRQEQLDVGVRRIWSPPDAATDSCL